DFVTGIRELSRVLAVRGRVLPAAGRAIVLKAEMVDGSIVTGESMIPKAGKVIKRVFLEPADVEPLEEAVEAIEQADAILIGPGSLYTSIIPNLLVPKLATAIVESEAVKLFVCNVMTQPGETDNYSVGDHLDAIHAHIGQHLFDYVIVNDGEIPPQIESKYAELGAKAVHLDLDAVTQKGYEVIADRLVLFRTFLRHDAERLSHHIYKLVENWMLRKRGYTMSFAAQKKKELTLIEADSCCERAELSALIRMNGSVSVSSRKVVLDISTENAAMPRRIYSLLKKHYELHVELLVRKKMRLKKNNVYIVRIPAGVQEILS